VMTSGLFFFKVPHFKTAGKFTVRFRLKSEGHRRVEPLTRAIKVELLKAGTMDEDTPGEASCLKAEDRWADWV
jgi:hypothetical protein